MYETRSCWCNYYRICVSLGNNPVVYGAMMPKYKKPPDMAHRPMITSKETWWTPPKILGALAIAMCALLLSIAIWAVMQNRADKRAELRAAITNWAHENSRTIYAFENCSDVHQYCWVSFDTMKPLVKVRRDDGLIYVVAERKGSS